MRKQILVTASIFLFILSLMIVFVAISGNTKQNIDAVDNIKETEVARPLTFNLVDSLSFDFPASKYNEVLEMFKLADIQAMRCQMYADSIVKFTLGHVNQYKFMYHYIPYTNKHFMSITDTITNNDCYMSKFTNSFVEGLICY